MNANVQQVSTGMERDASAVLVEESSTTTRISASVPKEQDGMGLDAQPLKCVKTGKNGMCLSLCVSAPLPAIGMEPTV